MDIATWIGIFGGIGVLWWGILSTGVGGVFINSKGLIIVIMGTIFSSMMNSSFSELLSAWRALFKTFRAPEYPSIESAITEVVRLATRAKSEGGILALQGEKPEFAGGFLARALGIATKYSESREVRIILEEDIRQHRIRQTADENVFRTMGILFPMFGLLGTLIGIVGVLKNMSDPTAVGPAMALSITTAFYGIGAANLFCVPLAGKMRTRAMSEMLLYEVLMEGVLDILASRQPFQVESHLLAYVADKSSSGGGAPPAAPGNQRRAGRRSASGAPPA